MQYSLLSPCNNGCTNAPQCYVVRTLPLLLHFSMSTPVFISLILLMVCFPFYRPVLQYCVKLCLNNSQSLLFVQCRIMLTCQFLAMQPRYSTLLSELCISCFLTHTHTHTHTTFLSHMNQLTTSIQPFPVRFPSFCPHGSCTQTYAFPHIVILNSVVTLAPHLRCWISATTINSAEWQTTVHRVL